MEIGLKADLHKSQVDFGTQLYQNTSAFPLQEQHIKAVQKILSSNIPVVLFERVPGSGKTASTLVWVVSTLRLLKRSVYATAPNAGGYAALQGDFAKTPEIIKPFNEVLEGKIKDAIVIIDEVYLTSLLDFQKLCAVAVQNNLKLILSGDSQQNLPPTVPIIGILDPLPISRLNESNRASQEEHKKFAGEVIRSGISTGLKNFEKDMVIVPNAQIVNDITSAALKEIKKPDDLRNVLFVAGDQQVDSLNDAFQRLLINNKIVTNRITVDVSYPIANPTTYIPEVVNRKIEIGIGTRIFMKKGIDSLGISEGAMGSVTKIDGTKITVNFNGKEKEFDTRSFNHFDYAYALTSAMSQGMSVNSVFVWLDRTMTLPQIYVALTRHKQRIAIYASAEQFAKIDLILQYKWEDFNKIAAFRMKNVMEDVIATAKK